MQTPGSSRPSSPASEAIANIVLIIDDVPENLSLLHDALDEAGYTVLVATRGSVPARACPT